MRFAFNTDVVVAVLRSDQRASRQFLSAALDRRIVNAGTRSLFLEYEAVLTRPEQLDVRHLRLPAASFGIRAMRPSEILQELRNDEHAKK